MTRRAASLSAQRPRARKKQDLRNDIRFLINLWNEIRGRAETSKAPALIYHDLNLVERILRDQVSGSFSAIWVDTEQEYERILRFVSRFQPSLVKRVKLYSKDTPLFEQFNITDEINKALKSKVWLQQRRLHRDQPDGSAGRHRHQHRQVRRQDGAPGRHHRQDQHRRHQGNRAADTPARPGRHHRDRLHRHGRAQESRRR